MTMISPSGREARDDPAPTDPSPGRASVMAAIVNRRVGLRVFGFAAAFALWYASVKWLPFPAFRRLPEPIGVIQEWLSRDPAYGISVFTADYYVHILYSTCRATTAFALAVVLGVPLGILMGWKSTVREYSDALLALLRPIPPLAWVPLAILLFPGTEPAVIFVVFLVAFYATTLNTWVGVRAIDVAYFRAALCLGARPVDVLRDVIVPGAMPSIFTGLQIAMGAAWFSLVAGEMIAARYGLGYVIWEAYNLIQYPTIVIGMVTLGFVGYMCSALIRVAGNRLMRWHQKNIGAVRG
jgi:NitT/TauT family transport system permease protein